MTTQFKDFSYCYSKDLNFPLSIKILSLEGFRTQQTYTELVDEPEKRFSGLNLPYYKSDLFVTVQLFSNGLPLTEKMQTKYQHFTNRWNWYETLTFPISISSLPVDSTIKMEIFDLLKPMHYQSVGACCLNLFTDNCKLRKGKQKLTLKTIYNGQEDAFFNINFKEYDEIDRLEKLMKKQESGDLDKVDWLDEITHEEIERIKERTIIKSNKLFLYIELPKFDFPLVFRENESNLPVQNITRGGSNLILVSDMEMYNDNPVEAKHRRLVRSHRSGLLDKDLKPNAKNRDQLYNIIKYPPTQLLSSEEKDILWKFRFYLTRDKKALTKFLKCVVWSDPRESQLAVEIMESWVDIDVEDALELLGPNFQDARVRSYAVRQLEKANDEELLLYLLQLVQALKFEQSYEDQQNISSLGDFLVKRGIRNALLGNRFIWYIRVECLDKKYGNIYRRLMIELNQRMKILAKDDFIYMVDKQNELIDNVLKLAISVKESKLNRIKSIEKFKHHLADNNRCPLTSFPAIPFPLDANIKVCGVFPEKCTIFKSNLLPIKLTFKTEDNKEYPVMFKLGDDLRQDQLVIQIIMLMDNLWRAENLDLKLTPYKVLATGKEDGIIQFIESSSLANVLADNDNSILSFLKRKHFDHSAPMKVKPEVMDNYLKSCAGYCVITYLLGVGDRHLDNLMLTSDGKLFHIDFGYFLGRDPKHFPPPMKLCKEMVEAMGGMNSEQYKYFLDYCFTAFNSLRKSANLILNLFSLMLEANIPDIANEPDKAVMKVQEKFRLDLSDEEAIKIFRNLIDESVSALFPQVIETIHKWAQYWRK